MKKSKNYRLSDKALATISFLMDKEWGKDATHVIECALAQAEAQWHMRDKLNADLGFATVGSGFVYSPDFFANSGDMINIPLNVSIPIPPSWSARLPIARAARAGARWVGVRQRG